MWIFGSPSFKRSDDKYARVSRGVWELVLDLQPDVLTQFCIRGQFCRLVEQGAVTLNMSTTREDCASRLVKSSSHADELCKLSLVPQYVINNNAESEVGMMKGLYFSVIASGCIALASHA